MMYSFVQLADCNLTRRSSSASYASRQTSPNGGELELIGGDNAISFSPVPFTGKLNANLHLNEDATVNAKILSIDGRLVTEIKDQNLKAGQEALSFDTNTWPAGVYFYRATIGSQNFSGKLVKQ